MLSRQASRSIPRQVPQPMASAALALRPGNALSSCCRSKCGTCTVSCVYLCCTAWPRLHCRPDALQAFEDTYRREFGFVLEDRSIFVDDLRVRATGKVLHAVPSKQNQRACHAGFELHLPVCGLRCQHPGQQSSHFLHSCSTSSLVQAVPHPEAGSIGKEPGKLPPRAKTASAYFEVTEPCWCSGCLPGTLGGSLQSQVNSIQAVTGPLLTQAAQAGASDP